MRLALLAGAVCLSVVVHADQQGESRDRLAVVAATETHLVSLRSQVDPARLSITLDPADPTHTRVVIGATLSPWIFESAAVAMTYTADGLSIDMKNGTFSVRGMDATPFEAMRLMYKDGEFVGMQSGTALR